MTCNICYKEETGGFDGFLNCMNKHPVCVDCLNEWYNVCMNKKRRTFTCQVCRKILRMPKDKRILIIIDNEEYLLRQRKINKLRNDDDSLELVKYLFDHSENSLIHIVV